MGRQLPPYFDYLIESFRQGNAGRCVHLGYWDDAPGEDATPVQGEFELAQARLDQVLADMATLRSGQAVLDVACGFGGTLESIDRKCSTMRLSGVNIDRRQLDLCRTLIPSNGNAFDWVQADACHLPFTDASFDRVFCVEAMFHFASRRLFFAEAARVLRRGGALVLCDIVIDGAAHSQPDAEAWVSAGFGPWPDFWGRDADHELLGRACGLRLAAFHDATAQTRRSHRFTAPPALDIRPDPRDPAMRAAVMLRWLHRSGHLRYPCLRFDKPA